MCEIRVCDGMVCMVDFNLVYTGCICAHEVIYIVSAQNIKCNTLHPLFSCSN